MLNIVDLDLSDRQANTVSIFFVRLVLQVRGILNRLEYKRTIVLRRIILVC